MKKYNAEQILSGDILISYKTNKAFQYIFKVVQIDPELKKIVNNKVEIIEKNIKNKNSSLFWNLIIREIKEDLKIENNVFIKNTEKMINRKITNKELNKIINNIKYSL